MAGSARAGNLLEHRSGDQAIGYLAGNHRAKPDALDYVGVLQVPNNGQSLFWREASMRYRPVPVQPKSDLRWGLVDFAGVELMAHHVLARAVISDRLGNRSLWRHQARRGTS